jgi:hypothetical protein
MPPRRPIALLSLLIVGGASACDLLAPAPPDPDSVLRMLREIPEVPGPQVTPANEGHPELQRVLGYVRLVSNARRGALIEHVPPGGTLPTVRHRTRADYIWYPTPPDTLILRAWAEEALRFELWPDHQPLWSSGVVVPWSRSGEVDWYRPGLTGSISWCPVSDGILYRIDMEGALRDRTFMTIRGRIGGAGRLDCEHQVGGLLPGGSTFWAEWDGTGHGISPYGSW